MSGTRFIVLLLGVGVIFGVLFYTVPPLFFFPLEPASQRVVTVEIPRGSSTARIADLLAKAGLIRSPFAFRALVAIRGSAGRLQAGEYELSPSLTPWQIIMRLERGEVIRRSFTVPEGATAADVARRLARLGYGAEEDFLRAFSDATLLDEIIPASGHPGAGAVRVALEGYLYPDTYRFVGRPRPEDFAAMMLRRLRDVWREELEGPARARGLDLHRLLTLASVVEREARADAERPVIAAVFWNRLKEGMRLDADPTVRYALGRFTGELLYRDLEVASPYNTYRYAGLPPGPIASPGLASLRAVLDPARVPYLYFVAQPDGRHRFAVTLTEHNRNVAAAAAAWRAAAAGSP